MKVGALTDPQHELIEQIGRLRQQGFDFAEVAVEPPRSAVDDLNADVLRSAAEHIGGGLLFRASVHLPLGSRHAGVAASARGVLAQTVELARAAGALLISIPYVGGPPYQTFTEQQDYYVALLNEMCDIAGGSMPVAFQNSPRNEREVLLFIEVFRRVPRLRLALDIGNANLNTSVNLAREFLSEPIVGGRLSHVYVSDNDGVGEQRLPLGSVRGGIDWPRMVALLQQQTYDGTVTLRVEAADERYLALSREKWRAWWRAEN